MSVADWKVIYRGYSGEELDEAIARAEKALSGGFVSQNSGSVGGTRDTRDLRERLRAATEVKQERSGGQASRVAKVDLSGARLEDF